MADDKIERWKQRTAVAKLVHKSTRWFSIAFVESLLKNAERFSTHTLIRNLVRFSERPRTYIDIGYTQRKAYVATFGASLHLSRKKNRIAKKSLLIAIFFHILNCSHQLNICWRIYKAKRMQVCVCIYCHLDFNSISFLYMWSDCICKRQTHIMCSHACIHNKQQNLRMLLIHFMTFIFQILLKNNDNIKNG